MLEKFVEYVVKEIARTPNDVDVSRQVSDGRDTITIRVSDQDRGRVVGRQGRTIKAIRAIVNAAAAGQDPVFVVVSE